MGAVDIISKARQEWDRLPPKFVPIVGITFLMWMGSSIIAPTLPLYAERLGLNATGVGAAVGGFFLGRMVFNLAGGSLADAWGLRRVAVAGCFFAGAGSFAAGFAGSFLPLVSARVLQGAGAGMYATAALSAIVALAPAARRGRLLATYQGLGFAGFSLGPVLGGAIGAWLGLEAPFFVFAGMAVIGMGVAMVWLPADLRPRELGNGDDEDEDDEADTGDVARPGRLRDLLQLRAFLVVLIVTFAFFAIRGGMRNSVVPLFAEAELGMTSFGIGVMIAISSIFNIAVLGHAGSALDRAGRRPVITWSLLATGLSVGAIALVTSDWALVLVMIVLASATGYGSVAPTTVTADIAPPAVRGMAIGVQRMVTDLGHMLGPLLAGLAADQLGFRTSFVVIGVLVVLVVALPARMPETRPPSRPDRKGDRSP
jgi:MFS family permease